MRILMVRFPQKFGRRFVLAVFSALAVCGPGLHHLPIFGLHGERCLPTPGRSDCEHEHGHADVGSPEHAGRIASERLARHLHDRCLVCDYYAQGKVVAAGLKALFASAPEVDRVAARVRFFSGRRPTDHLARGPPLLA